jgi:NitT/TauT family transport system permease protein
VSKPQISKSLLGVFTPNKVVSKQVLLIVAAFWILTFLIIWSTSPFKALPKPGEVLSAFKDQWMNKGLGQELLKSLALNVKALLASTLVCLALAYITVVPFFRPLVQALSKGRFLSLVGFSYIFTITIGGGETLKFILLVMGMSFFLLTSMAAVVESIPKSNFDHARTLRMPEWRVVWEVVILGTFSEMIEALRQNAAIGWMMLTSVEGIVRSAGGLGATLLNEQKHFDIPSLFAIQILVLLIGLTQDYAWGLLRKFVCPYAYLSLERK